MPFGVFILFRKSPFASAAPKAASKAALNTCSYVRIPRINQRAQSTTIETTLLLPFKRESSVMWERSKCPPLLASVRFCLDDDEDWKKRDRRRDDFDERREENLTLLDEGTEEEDARARFFSLNLALSRRRKSPRAHWWACAWVRAKVSKL